MASIYVVDAHALLWYFQADDVRLGAKAKAIMDDPASDLVLPAIALAEAAYVVERRRTNIPSVLVLLATIEADTRIEVYPLTLPVLRHSLIAAAIPEMHDRLIVATALYLESLGDAVALLTKDTTIARSGLVRVTRSHIIW